MRRRGFILFISNEDMDGILKLVELLEISGLLVNVAGETVHHEIIKQEGGFLSAMMASMVVFLMASMTSSLIQSIASSLINSITVKGQ